MFAENHWSVDCLCFSFCGSQFRCVTNQQKGDGERAEGEIDRGAGNVRDREGDRES